MAGRGSPYPPRGGGDTSSPGRGRGRGQPNPPPGGRGGFGRGGPEPRGRGGPPQRGGPPPGGRGMPAQGTHFTGENYQVRAEEYGGRGGRGGGQGRGADRGRGSDQGRGRGGRGESRGGGRGRGRGQPAELYRSRDPSAGAGPVGIIKMEDQMQDEMRKALLDDKLGMRQLQVSVKPPARPAFGTLGTQTLIWANYVDIVKKKDVEIFRYDITVSPTIEGGKLRRVFELFLQDSRFDPYRGIIASDLHGILLAAKRLDFKAFTCDVAYRQEGEDTPQPDSTLYRVTATFKTSYRLNTLIEYLSGTTGFAASLPDKIDIVQAVQILIGNFSKMSTSLVTAQNKVYPIEDAQAAVDLQYGLKAVRGYFFSVRPATGRLLLNVNVSSGAFYNDGTLSFEGELLQDEDRALKTLLNKRWGTVIGNDDLHKLSSFLCKLKVSVTHLKKFNNSGREIPQVKVIQALANPMDGFRMEDNIKKKNMEKPPLVDHFGANAKDVQFYYEKKGRYVTVQEFFKGEYGVTVDLAYPVVRYGTQDKFMYLPVDVCEIVPRQRYPRLLEGQETDKMREFAVKDPNFNALSIRNQGLQALGVLSGQTQLLDNFGISVGRELITTAGRMLNAPFLNYMPSKDQSMPSKGKPDPKPVHPVASAWNLRDVHFTQTGTLDNLSYLIIHYATRWQPHLPAQVGEAVQDFMQKFKRWAGNVGIRITNQRDPPRGSVVEIGDPDDSKSQLAREMARIAQAKVRYLVVFIPGDKKDVKLYNTIKRIGEQDRGVHTICILRGKALGRSGSSPTFHTNILHKLNLKLGGTNQKLGSVSINKFLNSNRVMFMGVDVTHPNPGAHENAPSIASVVANIDRDLGQWPAAIALQSDRKREMVSAIRGMVSSRVRLFVQANRGQYPEKIIVYRDGVSESQYQAVLEQEYPLIRDGCGDVYPVAMVKAGLPRISIIVVGKRHHTRLYPTKKEHADDNGNVRNGAVVDRTITEARAWEFFLVPHATLQGTSKPVRCYVVLDQIFRDYVQQRSRDSGYASAADMVEDLTHSLCYLFGRSTRAVSLCPPAYYADLACERARCYLSRYFEPGPALPNPTANDLRLDPFLRDSMFYM